MSKVSEETVRNELVESHALLNGHFLLSSGRHSGNYIQCAQLLRFPKKAEIVLSRVAEQIKESGIEITKVCGPAMGAILVSYEMGRLLDKEAIFTERNKTTDAMELRRGFTVSEGDKILIVEDAVTTGKSTMETVKVLEDLGATVVALGCIADRRTTAAVDLPFPMFSAIKLDFPSYAADECPLCKAGAPIVQHGSRKSAGM
ncbi:MAG: orotate phosphoribosyltransferase [Clostridiales bacterium]|jgi:orotate phosphoribosyltransferase|nr:orotate phosphoribosyltransferase [Clostridiales bacterium]